MAKLPFTGIAAADQHRTRIGGAGVAARVGPLRARTADRERTRPPRRIGDSLTANHGVGVGDAGARIHLQIGRILFTDLRCPERGERAVADGAVIFDFESLESDIRRERQLSGKRDRTAPVQQKVAGNLVEPIRHQGAVGADNNVAIGLREPAAALAGLGGQRQHRPNFHRGEGVVEHQRPGGLGAVDRDEKLLGSLLGADVAGIQAAEFGRRKRDLGGLELPGHAARAFPAGPHRRVAPVRRAAGGASGPGGHAGVNRAAAPRCRRLQRDIRAGAGGIGAEHEIAGEGSGGDVAGARACTPRC